VDRLPSGAYRVRIYAGSDPVTGKRHDLTELVPPGPRAAAEAEKVRTRLLSQLDERRNPRTKATLNQLLDRYIEVLDVDVSTRKTYLGYINNRIRPTLGELQVGRLDGEVLDSFYAELRRCRNGCTGRRRGIDHRTAREHQCDERCRPHVCRPLAASTVRQIHWILSGALERAVRWRWIAVSPATWAEPPSPPQPSPQPPSAEDAARMLTEAWKDQEWGTFLWLAMTTGARRGELCALRRRHVDLDGAVLIIEMSVGGRRSATRQKDTKTHQMRRIALDTETVEILREHIANQDDRVRQLGVKTPRDPFLFSLDPDCGTPLLPDSVSQRFDRLAARLDVGTSLHKLRHYNATELIGAGVDVRTVAGRLGHGGGGATTLRVYAAWVNEADRRAADAVSSRLPRRPTSSVLSRKFADSR
jgi:integrase